MAHIDVELPPGTAAGGDERFTDGTLKAAVAWALDAVAKAAGGDTDAIAAVARAGDVARLRAEAVRLAPSSIASARVTDLRLDADPPHVVADVLPSAARVLLKAVEFPNPGWRLAALAGATDALRVPLPERLLTFALPDEARRGHQLDWIIATLATTAAVLGADILPAVLPDTVWATEELGQGETRSVDAKWWRVGDVEVTAEVAEHEIFDGATPRWTYLHGTVTGLPPDAGEVWVTASIRVGPEPTGRIFVIGPREVIDRVAGP